MVEFVSNFGRFVNSAHGLSCGIDESCHGDVDHFFAEGYHVFHGAASMEFAARLFSGL